MAQKLRRLQLYDRVKMAVAEGFETYSPACLTCGHADKLRKYISVIH